MSTKSDQLVDENVLLKKGENGKSEKIKLYKRRYLILLILSLALFANGEAWMTFGSVTTQSMVYYNTTEQNINWFGTVFLLAYAIEAIPCTFVPQIIGLKWTILVGCILNFAGILLRLLSLFISVSAVRYDFIIAIFGNLLFGFGQGFLLNIPSMVSSRWFGDSERSISTAVAYMSNAIGVGIGFLDIFIVVGTKKSVDDIGRCFLMVTVAETCLNAGVLLLAFIFLREKPKYPPSKSEVMISTFVNADEPLLDKIKYTLKSMGRLLTRVESLSLIFVFSAYYGNYTSIFIFLSSLVGFISDESNITGYAGAVGVILGGVLTTVIGIILERTKNKYNQRLGTLIQVICAITLIIILILFILKKLPLAVVFILIITFLLFCSPYISIGAELLAEITYPLDPNVSTNEALIFGNIFGVLMTYLIGLIPGDAKHYSTLGVAIALYLVNTLILLLLPLKRNRDNLTIDKRKATPNTSN